MHLLPRAFDVFGARVHEVSPDAWDNATPDSEWTVRDLVNHLVSEHLWAPRLIGGETLEDVGEEYGGDVIGRVFADDPLAAWDSAAGVSRAAWAAVDDPALPVHLGRGPTPVVGYANEMLMDLVVHAWDLARGAGLEESGDADAVAHVLKTVEADSHEWLGSGFFAPPVMTDSTDPLTRLVALLGRQP